VAGEGEYEAAGKAVDYEFGEGLRLEGYDVAVAGEEVEVRLHWQGLGEMEDLAVSVQLLDGVGQLVGQVDGEPQGGLYPTSYWRQGERVVERRRLSLGDMGEYRLVVVVYGVGTQQRLPVRDGTGRPLGDSLDLGAVSVGSP
jgi:hypothetical protein